MGDITVQHLTGPQITIETSDQTVVLAAHSPPQITISAPTNVQVFGANVGAGAGEVFRDKVGSTLNFRTITGVNGASVSVVGDTVEIDVAASGDVDGPSSAIDNELALFDGITGKVIKGGSGWTVIGGDLSGNGTVEPDGVEFTQVAANPGTVPTNTVYQDDGTNFSAGTLVWTNSSVFNGDQSVGDPGFEQGGIDVNGTTFDAVQKINDFGGTRTAQLILHRHSTSFPATLVCARSNSDTSAHAAVTPGQILAQQFNVGWTGSHYDIASRIDFGVPSGGTVGPTSLPGDIAFYTSPDGTTTPTLAMTIQSDQTVLFGGDIDLGTNAITNVGLVDGVDISAHATRHSDGGADEINASDLGSGVAGAGLVLTSDGIGGNSYAAAGVSDHGALTGLVPDDDHTQYLLLAGRAGGQSAIGGTAVSEELTLRGTTNANLGQIRCASPIDFDDTQAANALNAYFVQANPTQSFAGSFIGGGYNYSPAITFNNGLTIIEGLRGSPNILTNIAPTFAAFTLFQALPVLRTVNTLSPLNTLVLNAGPATVQEGAASATTSTVIGLSFSPQTRATLSGGTMSVTNQDAVRCQPTFSTVTGTTINLGTITGLRCNAPAPALFQPSTGVETLTAYYGIDFADITFTSTGDKVVVRSAMTDAGDRLFLQNNGGARSDFGGGLLLDCGAVQVLVDNIGLQLGAAGGDCGINWNGSALEFDPLVGDDMRISFAVGTHTIQSSQFATNSELLMGFDRFAFGQTSAVGNQVGIFVAPTRSTSINGGWSDFLLTQSGNLTINHAMSGVSAWAINAVSLTAGTGSITGDIATLEIGGMTTSGIGANPTSALLIRGRSVHRGAVNLHPISPAQLTADDDDSVIMGTGNAQRSVVRVSSDASRTISGFDVSAATVRENDTIWITNVGSFDVVLGNQDVGSVATNRIISPTGANLTLGANESALLWYDDTDTRWRILYHTGA